MKHFLVAYYIGSYQNNLTSLLSGVVPSDRKMITLQTIFRMFQVTADELEKMKYSLKTAARFTADTPENIVRAYLSQITKANIVDVISIPCEIAFYGPERVMQWLLSNKTVIR